MDFACSNMVIYDTSKSVSFIKVSETYSSTKISDNGHYYFSMYKTESCCTAKIARNTCCIC